MMEGQINDDEGPQTATTITPSRRVLLELCPYLYAVGNSPSLDLLQVPAAAKQPSISALLLGCGDPRHVLRSIADCSAGTKSVKFLVNDCNTIVVARAGLLLHLAATLDTPGSSQHAEALFEVWSNTQLRHATAQILISTLD